MVGSPLIDTGLKITGPMTVDEFYAFTDTRPDEEKWELIGGEPILNAAPSPLHQLIVGNVISALSFIPSVVTGPMIVDEFCAFTDTQST